MIGHPLFKGKKKKKKKLSKSRYNLEVQSKVSGTSSVKLKDCVVCMAALADAVIMPCGHGGICYICALEMLKNCCQH